MITATSKLLKSLKIIRPTLVIDKNKVIRNIDKITRKAKRAGVRLRPHFKTHQSAEIGNWFRDLGTEKITVSSLDMALYFSNHGWSDITVAFPVNILEIDKINNLANKIRLNLLVDSEQVVSALNNSLKHPVRIWIKVDVGYGRTGVLWNNYERIFSLTQKIHSSTKLEFSGLLTHSGHSYQASTINHIEIIHAQSIARLLAIKDNLKRRNFKACEISIGDTPTCSLMNNFSDIDEIRPGNFVFYDLMQHTIGSCTEDEIAIAVACPIVGKYKERNQIVVYGGAVHLSQEYILDADYRKIFGYLAYFENQTFGPLNKKAPVVSLSQEHGIIQVNDKLFEKIHIADLVLIFPVHSCLTCNLYKEYITLDGRVVSRL